MKFLVPLLGVALTAPAFAQRVSSPQDPASIYLVCQSLDNRTVVFVENMQEHILGNDAISTTASVVVVRFKGQAPHSETDRKFSVAGLREESAKGPYYDLAGPGGSEIHGIFLAAPASASPDRVTLRGETVELKCR